MMSYFSKEALNAKQSRVLFQGEFDSRHGRKLRQEPQMPESLFECPKLNQGNMVSLDAGKSRRQRILTPVKVFKVSMDIG